MADTGRQSPYSAFNFTVTFGGDDIGGFSDVSGLSTDVTIAEYREGDDLENHVHKVPGMHKFGDVTLKRGIIDSKYLWEWIKEVHTSGISAQRNVTITMKDETRVAVQSWLLTGVVPMKYSGPTLAAKGGSDVAMEELVLSIEKMEFTPEI